MKKKLFCDFLSNLALLSLVVLSSCKNNAVDIATIKTIKLSEYQVKEFTWESWLGQDAHIVELSDTSKEYSFSDVSKLVLKADKLYISDWPTRRILIFDINGNPVSVINRRGRGPEEYLQVTDFDADDKGSVWVLDGQQDMVKHYSSNGDLLSQAKTGDCQYSNILFKDGYLFLSVSAWDKTENKDYKVVQTDTCLNVISGYGRKPEFMDSDFTYPAVGFNLVNDEVMYNSPIDDYVSVMDSKGYEGDILFDFGAKRVPDVIRQSVEPHQKEIPDYSFLVNCVGVFNGFAAGTLHEGTGYVDFLLDEKNKTIYKHSLESGSLHLTSFAGDRIVLSGIDVNSGNTIIAYASLSSIGKD